jgi:hypothetical protein
MESAFPYLLWYGFRDSSGWRIDLVDPVWQDEGDFAFSWPLISAGWWCIPRISYYPYYDASGYREKYAELTPFKPTNTLWHAIRKGPDNWEEQEYITAGIGPCARFLADKKGYLHFLFETPGTEDLWYATTRPDVGVFESLPEPEPGLVLISAPSGFWITGYSGEVRIYDPAGRLVLIKEIKGKTLISPLKLGFISLLLEDRRAR